MIISKLTLILLLSYYLSMYICEVIFTSIYELSSKRNKKSINRDAIIDTVMNNN